MGAKKFAPLTGVGGIILIFAGLGVAGSTPNGASSASKVAAFYSDHTTSQTGSGILLGFGSLLFLVFSAVLAARLQRESDDRLGASSLCLVGGVLIVVSIGIYAGLSVTFADVVGHISDSGLQALNVLANDAVFVVIAIGTSAFALGAATAILTSRILPRWLGWFAFLIPIVAAVPSHVLGGTLDHIGLAAFAGLGVWTLVVGVMLAMKAPRRVRPLQRSPALLLP